MQKHDPHGEVEVGLSQQQPQPTVPPAVLRRAQRSVASRGSDLSQAEGEQFHGSVSILIVIRNYASLSGKLSIHHCQLL